MFVVIFRARLRVVDAEYSVVAARLRELALSQFGCLSFHSVTEGRDEVALSYWPSEAAIVAWKSHPEHTLAQDAGRTRWYESYSIEVGHLTREYRWDRQQSTPGLCRESE